MCFEFWRSKKTVDTEERARREAEAAIEKARAASKPREPATPVEEPPSGDRLLA